MRKIFSRFGNLVNIYYNDFQISLKSNQNRTILNGFGVVEFSRASDAWTAWLELHKRYFNGCLYVVKENDQVCKIIKMTVCELDSYIDLLLSQ